jgi:hypothetical protein
MLGLFLSKSKPEICYHKMYLFHLSNLPFALMLGIAFVFLALQSLGGAHGSDHGSIETNTAELSESDLDNPWLGLINIGKLPLSLVLILFFFSWGACGLFFNTVLSLSLQAHPYWLFPLALVSSLLPTVLITRIFSKLFASFFQENTSATLPDELIGCVGTVISGQVPNSIEIGLGRAHIYTEHGVLLQISCLSLPNGQIPQKNQTIFVTGYDPNTHYYSVVLHESDDFLAYLNGPNQRKESIEARLKKSRAQLDNLKPHSEKEEI